MDWFRSWHNAPTDSKWLLIARKAQVAPGMVSAVAWALMDYASQNTERGSVEGFDPETYASWAGWDEGEVIAVIAAMRAKGTITSDGRLAAWDKRQPKREDPGGTQRVREWRNKQRNAEVTQGASVTDDVTHGNAMLRDVTHGNDRSDKIRSDQKRERDEGLARPPASSPPPSQEPADPEYGAALSKLECLGMMTGSALLEFQALWPDLRNGKRSWLDDAITVAQANKASSPVYAVRVLANAVKTGNRPGQVATQPTRAKGRDLNALLGIINGNS